MQSVRLLFSLVKKTCMLGSVIFFINQIHHFSKAYSKLSFGLDIISRF